VRILHPPRSASTLGDAASLLEPKQLKGDLYIHRVFDAT
jgi:hypothetical protein